MLQNSSYSFILRIPFKKSSREKAKAKTVDVANNSSLKRSLSMKFDANKHHRGTFLPTQHAATGRGKIQSLAKRTSTENQTDDALLGSLLAGSQ
jgi:hypothetical protein